MGKLTVLSITEKEYKENGCPYCGKHGHFSFRVVYNDHLSLYTCPICREEFYVWSKEPTPEMLKPTQEEIDHINKNFIRTIYHKGDTLDDLGVISSNSIYKGNKLIHKTKTIVRKLFSKNRKED